MEKNKVTTVATMCLASTLAFVFALAGCDSVPSPEPPTTLTVETYETEWRWRYGSPLLDITPGAVLGSRDDFLAWRKGFAEQLADYYNRIEVPTPSGVTLSGGEVRSSYRLQTASFHFPNGALADGTSISGLLAVPNHVDATLPLIIALHGHESGPRGQAPTRLFDEHTWAEKFAEAGYVVWAPQHLFYKALAPLYDEFDHTLVWAKVESVLLDAIRPHLPQYDQMAIAGLSSGGLTGPTMMAFRSDIKVGVFAGSLLSLDYLRENYRIKGHPNQWDMRMLTSYAPLYMLIAPRPVQWQMGRKDDFFPSTSPMAPKDNWFPGTPRGVMTSEVVGEFLMLKEVWGKMGAPVSLLLHSGGHNFDFEAGAAFIDAQLATASSTP